MKDLHKEPRTAVHLYLSSFDHSQMHCHSSGTAEKRSNREIKQSFGLDCVSLSSFYRIPCFSIDGEMSSVDTEEADMRVWNGVNRGLTREGGVLFRLGCKREVELQRSCG